MYLLLQQFFFISHNYSFFSFIDSSSKKLYEAKVAFQVHVRPGSYTIGPQQLGACDPIDTRFSNNDLEWYIKEENSITLHSLLMKVDPVWHFLGILSSAILIQSSMTILITCTLRQILFYTSVNEILSNCIIFTLR